MFCCALAWPAAAQPNGGADAGVEPLQNFLAEVQTLEADFRQTLFDTGGRLIETSEGLFRLRRPDRFLWHYETPIEQIIVADGERLWMYDVELAQATVTALDDAASSSPAMLLSGDEAVRDSFEIEETFRRDGYDLVRLAPKLAGTDFSTMLIGFDEEGLPRRLEWVDGLDQTTRIEFLDVTVNEPLPADTFELDLPRRVDVIGSDG